MPGPWFPEIAVAAEAELRAQIDQYAGLLNLGPMPKSDHADYANAVTATGQPQIDAVGMTPGVDTAETTSAYRNLLVTTKPGVTFIAPHRNAPGDDVTGPAKLL